MNQDKTPIIEALELFNSTSPEYFCIPAHHTGKGIDKRLQNLIGKDIFKYDLTETPITDDLHAPESAILEAQQLAAHLFETAHTFFLINGTTCANEAMILSATNEGDKILVARNCHKSVLAGLILSGTDPIYIMPKTNKDLGLWREIDVQDVQEAFEKNPDIKAFILTSPTYYGISSDIKKIASICHSHNASLLVDEAHGAHFIFSNGLPPCAIQSGADLAAQSTHKTLGSMTQSSMLHFNSKLIDISKVNAALKLVQSTSPSYILMASLDAARHNFAINGESLIKNAIDVAKYIRDNLNNLNGIMCIGEEDFKDYDLTRIVFNINGISGFDVQEILFNEYNICTEMADEKYVIAIVSFADSKKEADNLISAVKLISTNTSRKNHLCKWEVPIVPPKAMAPRKAYFSKTTSTPIDDCVGKTSAEAISPYPPGIPVIYPGEIITEEIYEYIKNAIDSNQHIHGFSDNSMKTIKTVSS